MNIRLIYTLRTLPLVVYGVLVFLSPEIYSFDFWTPMIDISNFLNWLLAGIFNVILLFVLLYIRLMISKFSFQSLNENIPHSDVWELTQFYLSVLVILLVIVNGLLLTFFIYNDNIFQTIQIWLLVVPFIIDITFHLKWIMLN